MVNEQKEEIEDSATIIFDIPAYIDKNTGKIFHKEVRVCEKKRLIY
jgi:hypothetical protein